jgi:thiol-disulfide isomerase/thioredoxin
MKKFITGILFILIAVQLSAQKTTGYRISVNIAGLKDSTIYLAYHFGDKQYLKDTTALDSRGSAVFSDARSLPQGIYMVVLPGRTYFEILVTDDQHFSASCKYNDYLNTLEFSGSEENTRFIKYQKTWVSLQQEASALAKRVQVNRQNADSIKLLSEKQKIKEQEMKSYLRSVISENGKNFLAVLVKAMLPLEFPEFNIPGPARNPDSLKWVMRYNYNTDHFFDNIDLSDDRILRTPLLHARLDAYFTGDPIQAADSINRKIDKVLSRCKANHDVFQYVAVWLFNHYRESEIMGHDAVMVKLADEIYLSGKADWVTQEFRDKLAKDIELLRNNLIGMTAKDLVMDSYRGIHVSLHDIEKDFTILYFWEPDCGHCKEATPKLKDFYNKPKDYTLEVFAVCTIADRQKWSDYIEKNGLLWINGWDPNRTSHYDYYYNVQSTPIIYILDRNKKIIAKKLAVEDIAGFIENYRKFFR